MKNIKFFFFISSCLLLCRETMAHQPDLSSTLLVEYEENRWILQVRAALTAFEYEVESKYGSDSYTTPEEFQNLVVDLVRDHLSIVFNEEQSMELIKGVVQLGHETTVTFEVEESPSDIASLFVKNSTFSNISRNQSALVLLKKGFTKNQFMLDGGNQHSVNLQVKNNEFILAGNKLEKKQSKMFLTTIAIGALLAIVIIFIIQNLKFKSTTPMMVEI